MIMASRVLFPQVILPLLAIAGSATAAEKLQPEQMDRVTSGVLASASDANAFFAARAMGEGLTANADAEVGGDFARAQASSASVGADSAAANSSAEVVAMPPPPAIDPLGSAFGRLKARLASLKR